MNLVGVTSELMMCSELYCNPAALCLLSWEQDPFNLVVLHRWGRHAYAEVIPSDLHGF